MAKRKKSQISLLDSEHEKIRVLLKKKFSGRVFKRIMILQMLDQKKRTTTVSKIVGVTRKTVTNISKRYLEEGLNYALYDKPRTGRKKVITGRHNQEIIAIACSDPPEAYSRWTLTLLAEITIKKRLLLRLVEKKLDSS